MNIWFTSDLHFSHRNISKFCPLTRPDVDPSIMDAKMILRWNQQVKPDDTVWSLGDMFFCDDRRALSIMARLNGKINLIYGNHDKTIRNSRDVQQCFQSIHEYYEFKHEGKTACLFHYPIYEWNKLHHGSYHLHGHIHERISGVPGRILNVCMDSGEMGNYEGTLPPYSLYSWESIVRACEKREVRMHGKAKSGPGEPHFGVDGL